MAAPSAVLTAFTAGKSTALVLESGAGMTCVSAVYDGHLLHKSVHASPMAGAFLTAQAARRLAAAHIPPITPQYLVAAKRPVDAGAPAEYTRREERALAVTPSYHAHVGVARALCDWKETVCQLAPARMDDKTLAGKGRKRYEFPDGFNTSFGAERFKVGEALFDAAAMLPPAAAAGAAAGAELADPMDARPHVPVHRLVLGSVQASDVDVRPALLANVLVAGGTTLMPGFLERLNAEMYYGATGGSKVKLHPVGAGAERRFAAWLGGSILASCGTFHQAWISKAQWEEGQAEAAAAAAAGDAEGTDAPGA